jgi:hypothetical protein
LAIGLEILHAWKSVSEFPPTVEMHLEVMEPWSRMAIETVGGSISAGCLLVMRPKFAES